MAKLNKDELLALAGNLKTREIELEELDAVVVVREMTAAQRDNWGNRMQRELKRGAGYVSNARALLLMYTVVDADGSPMFTDDDLEQISKLPTRVVEPLVKAAEQLNGMAAGSVEEAEKN